MFRSFATAWMLFAVAGVVASRASDPAPLPANVPAAREILASLRKEHPRLLATPADFARLRQQVATDPQLIAWHKKLKTHAEGILEAPPSQYEIPDGLRLLHTSRRVLDRVSTLGLLYQLDRDERYVERAWRELEAAAAFKDWNPRHFLDTAEMTHAFALGYDWFYEAWTPERRTILRTAMVEKALNLARDAYRGTGKYGWWVKARHNWNQVCNGGIGIGALALGDELPELAGEILRGALESLKLPLAEFAPDGAWNEGPGYWNYATSYNVAILAALDTALGTDFGLSDAPGFSETGTFPLYASGPTGRTFNYADASDSPIRAPQLFWLARKFARSEYAAFQARAATPAAFDLLWYEPRGETRLKQIPLDRYYQNVDVTFFRGSWEDKRTSFIGFKGGDNRANHSNLDLGSFVFEALGNRWAVDLGADNYNLPGYFGKSRWNYYRMRAEGHNTLVINPGTAPDQEPAAAAPMVRFESKPDWAYAVADLTAAYKSQARKVTRGVGLIERRKMIVQDEVRTDQPSEVWWFMHTPAQIAINRDGNAAILSQSKTWIRVELLSPPGATFTIMDPKPLPSSPQPEAQARNDGIRKLAVHLSGVREAQLTVLLTPLRDGERPPDPPPVTPLAQW
ncbi:MAG: DUF4962 domain-containing protein [Verrucomicrobiota bacterium]